MRYIAITCRLSDILPHHEIRQSLDINWGLFFSENKIIPIIISYNSDFSKIIRDLHINEIIISGGNDLVDVSNKRENILRNSFENDIITYAVENDIKLFGICYGMQVIGNYFGNSCIKTTNHIAAPHAVNYNKNSRFYEDIKNLEIVNSYHGYGFKEVNSEFNVVARSHDGIIEAIEHRKYKVYGQMWHPERNISKKIYGLKLI